MLKTNGPKFGNFAEPSYLTSQNSKGLGISNDISSKAKQGSSNDSKFDSNDYVPKRFALKFDPPTIIVEYLVPSSGKLYHHKIKLSQLQPDSDTLDMLDLLKKKHHGYFAGNKISDAQMKNFIEKLKKKLQGASGNGTNNILGGYGENINQSGNKLGKPNLSTPSKGDFLATSDANKEKVVKNLKTPTPSKEKSNNFWDFEDLEDYDDEPKVDYNSANLNKLSKEELQKHKDKMDVLFNKNQKKPGETGFVYDKQEEFIPQEDNEWDEDEDF